MTVHCRRRPGAESGASRRARHISRPPVGVLDDDEAYENASAFLAEFHARAATTVASFRSHERLGVIDEVPPFRTERSATILNGHNRGLSRRNAVSSCLSSMAEEVANDADTPELEGEEEELSFRGTLPDSSEWAWADYARDSPTKDEESENTVMHGARGLFLPFHHTGRNMPSTEHYGMVIGIEAPATTSFSVRHKARQTQMFHNIITSSVEGHT